MNPKVSICLAQYNRAEYLRPTLDSLLSQSYDAFEVIVVNDGSSDARVREILDSYHDTRLTVIHQQNAGFINAIRHAIDTAKGGYIAIQGAGDVSHRDRIRKQAECLDANPQVGVVGCHVDMQIIGGPKDGLTWVMRHDHMEPDLQTFLARGCPFTHGETMYRKALYQRVGGYRSYFKFAQDFDLWIRMGEHCDFRILDQLLYHRKKFYDDGVSMDRSNVILQRRLADFAKQCHHDRIEFGTDFIERFGSHAGLFRRPSKTYAKYCTKQAIAYKLTDDDKAAETLLRYAEIETRTAFAAVTRWVFTLFDLVPLSKRLVKRYVKKVYSLDRLTAVK